jgi:hypothetical protein
MWAAAKMSRWGWRACLVAAGVVAAVRLDILMTANQARASGCYSAGAAVT